MINGVPFGYLPIYTGVPVPFNAVLDCQFADSAPGTEPVTLADTKLWCKIDVTDDDALITALITTARQMCEQYACISFIPRTITAVLNNSNGGMYLPYGPVNSFTSLTDENGVAIVSDNYQLSGLKYIQIVRPWQNRLTAVYTAGFASGQLPQEFKNAIMQQVFYLYENRGDIEQASRTGTVVTLGLSSIAKTILKPLRRV